MFDIINITPMIEKHYNLSCYAMQPPFNAEYADYGEEVVNFIDSNNDIYQFKLLEPELYEKINVQKELKQFKRMGSLTFLLDVDGILLVRRRADELFQFSNIGEIQMMQIGIGTIVVLRSNQFYNRNQIELQIGFIKEDKESNQQLSICFQTYILEQQTAQHDHFQKYIPQIEGKQCKIQKLINKCCLIVDNHGGKFIFRLDFEKMISSQDKMVKYGRLDFELHENIVLLNSFKDKILVKNGNQTYLMDSQHEKIVLIKQFGSLKHDTQYVILNNFIIILVEHNLIIYEIIKGNKMAEINVDAMLQQFEEGSSIILNEQPKKEIRYCLLFDNLKSKITHFYLLDKEKLALYHFNINKLLQRGFIKTIKESLKDLQNDNEKYHENIMKTMSFRFKKLESLEKYLLEDLKNGSFGNTIRFLINQQTMYVLNDGLSLFYHAIMSNITKLMNNKPLIVELEREIIKICQRLITESNYQNQIANGLHIINGVYTNFRKYEHFEGLQRNKEGYIKLLETNRVTKLLKNDKKRKLFELSYELALKIKGYKYLQSLQPSKGK